MKLNHIHIYGFGKFRDLQIDLSEDINIIYGRNEAGKSTLHAFLMAMFFGMDEKPARIGKEDSYSHYRNWQDPDIYGGEICFSHGGRSYVLRRDFNLGGKHMELYAAGGEKLPEGEKILSEALSSLTESAYRSTASIGQLKAATGREMIRELKRYVDNLSSTGSPELSADAAISYLDAEKERIEKEYDKDAVKTYASLIGQIKNLEGELASSDNDNRLRDYRDLRESVEAELSEAEKELSELRERRERAGALLSENGFADRHSIDELEDRLLREQQLYLRKKKSSESMVKRAVPVISLVVAALCAGAGFYFTGLEDIYFAGIMGAALLMLIISVTAGALLRKKRSEVRKLNEELSAEFEKHTGSGELDEDAASRLHERMEGFRRIYDTDIATSGEESAISDRMIELGRRRSDCQEDIYRQQGINRGVEEKLLKLNALRNRVLELRNIIAENNRLKDRMDAIDLAKEELSAMSTELRSSVGARLNQEAGRILGKVTGGAYSRLEVTDGMEIFINTRERSIPLSSLSMGTMDQVYLALRLSAIGLIEGEGSRGSLPLFFDDSFTLYDDERLGTALRTVTDSYEGQLLIFTCQHREEKVLSDMGIAHKYIELA